MQSLKLNKPHLPHVFGCTVLLISKYLLRHLSLPCLHIIMSSPLITSFGFSFNCFPFSFPLCQSSELGNRNHCYLKQKEIQYRELRLKELLRGWSCLLQADLREWPPKARQPKWISWGVLSLPQPSRWTAGVRHWKCWVQKHPPSRLQFICQGTSQPSHQGTQNW